MIHTPSNMRIEKIYYPTLELKSRLDVYDTMCIRKNPHEEASRDTQEQRDTESVIEAIQEIVFWARFIGIMLLVIIIQSCTG